MDRASSSARGVFLEHLDKEGSPEDVLSSAIMWGIVDNATYFLMLRDTWRRIWCLLVLVDHDAQIADNDTKLFPSTILDIKVDYSALVEDHRRWVELVCRLGNSEINPEVIPTWASSENYITNSPRCPAEILVLVESVKLIEVRHSFVVSFVMLFSTNASLQLWKLGINTVDDPPTSEDCDPRLLLESSLLQDVYNYRRCQVRLLIRRNMMRGNCIVDSQTRRDDIQPALDMLALFQSSDWRLRKWLSTATPDIHFAQQAISDSQECFSSDGGACLSAHLSGSREVGNGRLSTL